MTARAAARRLQEIRLNAPNSRGTNDADELEEAIVADERMAFPWQGYFERGLITRRQLVKLTALFGTAAAAGSVLSEPAPAAAALAPAAKQVLRYPDTEPLHFDPATIEARPEILISMALFDPLITFDDSGTIVPVAARS